MKKILQLVSMLTLLACSNKNTLTVELTNASGLYVTNPVYSNGLIVGEIDRLSISSRKSILVTVRLTEDLQQIPIDSKITMASDGILGGKALHIDLGTSSDFFARSDTLQLSNATNPPPIEPTPLTRVIENGIDLLTSGEKIDSILIELRRLNENLEAHRKEHNSP